MFVLSSDPNQAQRELHGLIFYLATFSYIDGSFDPSEMDFIRKTIWQVVEHRIASSSRSSDPRQREELVRRYTAELDRVLEANRREMVNILGGIEAEKSYATDQLKEHCFEILQSFTPTVQEELLQTVEELLAVDGKANPTELEFRQELQGELQRLGTHREDVVEAPPAETPELTIELIEVMTTKEVFAFDGRVVEVFASYKDQPIRFHIRHLKKVEYGTRNWKGHMSFSIAWGMAQSWSGTVEPEHEEEMRQFFDMLKQARGL